MARRHRKNFDEDDFLQDLDFGISNKPSSPVIAVEIEPGFRETHPDRLFSVGPTVIEVNEFDADGVRSFERSISQAMQGDQKVIPVVIDSFGGDVYSLFRMVDLIRVAQGRGLVVATVATGKAMSCGAVLLAAGTEGFRYATPETMIMVHEVSSMVYGKSTDMVVDAKVARSQTNRLYAILDEACGKDSGFWEKKVHGNKNADLYLTAKDALKVGLISGIGLPTLKVSAIINYEWFKP